MPYIVHMLNGICDCVVRFWHGIWGVKTNIIRIRSDKQIDLLRMKFTMQPSKPIADISFTLDMKTIFGHLPYSTTFVRL